MSFYVKVKISTLFFTGIFQTISRKTCHAPTHPGKSAEHPVPYRFPGQTVNDGFLEYPFADLPGIHPLIIAFF